MLKFRKSTNFTIRSRLMFTLVLIFIILFAIGIISNFTIYENKNVFEKFSEQEVVTLSTLYEFQENFINHRSIVFSYVGSRTIEQNKVFKVLYDKNIEKIRLDFDKISKLNTFDKRKLAIIFEKIEYLIVDYDRIIELQNDLKTKEANDMLYEKTALSFESIHKDIETLISINKNKISTVIKKQARNSLLYQIFMILITTVGVFVVFIFTKRLITTIEVPITKAENYMLNFARGKFKQKIEQIDFERKDEIGRIFQAIVKIKEKISNVVVNLKNLSKILRIDSDKIDKSSEEIFEATATQYRNFKKIKRSIDNAIDAASSSVEKTKHSAIKAISAKKSMQDTIDSIKNIEKSAVKIEKSISGIMEIVEQANLLSVNASIEAAKAGEMGKGFAIVSDEVKKLSEKSNKTAQDIINHVSESKKFIINGVRISKESGKNLEDIIEEVNYIFKNVEYINNEMQNQGKAVEENTDVINNIFTSAKALKMSVSSLKHKSSRLNLLVQSFDN